MTRINLVDPSQLTDKHLLAEYRELPRIFTAVRKLLDKCEPRRGDAWTSLITSNEIKDNYLLGKGHVKFFYNKIPFLLDRYKEISYVLRINRKFKINKTLMESAIYDAEQCIIAARLDMLHEWKPSPEEIYLNMARLCKRSKLDNVLKELEDA